MMTPLESLLHVVHDLNKRLSLVDCPNNPFDQSLTDIATSFSEIVLDIGLSGDGYRVVVVINHWGDLATGYGDTLEDAAIECTDNLKVWKFYAEV
jgi:hypothetical protein